MSFTDVGDVLLKRTWKVHIKQKESKILHLRIRLVLRCIALGMVTKAEVTWLLWTTLMMLRTATATEKLILANSYDSPSTANRTSKLKGTNHFLVEGRELELYWAISFQISSVCFLEDRWASAYTNLWGNTGSISSQLTVFYGPLEGLQPAGLREEWNGQLNSVLCQPRIFICRMCFWNHQMSTWC